MTSIKRMIGLCIMTGLLMALFAGNQTVYADAAQKETGTQEYKTGKIDKIRLNRVIIDDIQYTFSQRTQFLSESGKPIDISMFNRRDRVMFYATANKELLILKKP